QSIELRVAHEIDLCVRGGAGFFDRLGKRFRERPGFELPRFVRPYDASRLRQTFARETKRLLEGGLGPRWIADDAFAGGVEVHHDSDELLRDRIVELSCDSSALLGHAGEP